MLRQQSMTGKNASMVSPFPAEGPRETGFAGLRFVSLNFKPGILTLTSSTGNLKTLSLFQEFGNQVCGFGHSQQRSEGIAPITVQGLFVNLF